MSDFDPVLRQVPVVFDPHPTSDFSKPQASHGRRVELVAPARLHMGFLDLAGSLGRRFGSIGVGINEIATRVSLVRSDRLTATGPDAKRALLAAERLAEELGRELPAAIQIEEAIPGHAGLGSGTQLALAVGAGLSHLFELGLSAREIAPVFERGARSGIGIAVFEQGGFIVDGGRGEDTVIPPVLARLEVPEHWRFILILDESDQGLHGPEEARAFRTLPAFRREEAARLCHSLLMRGLPALAEGDIEGFGACIAEVQRSIGDYFAPAQGGRFTSGAVADALVFLEARGAVGIGQSSWGPTGFCLVDGIGRAEELLRELQGSIAADGRLRCLLGSARNVGAEIRIGSEPAI